jgi:hypothetical protein
MSETLVKSALERVLDNVFDNGAEKRLPAEDERTCILAAKNGDSDAFVELIYAYAAVLRAYGKRYSPQFQDETRDIIVNALWQAIVDFDLESDSRRLGHRVHTPLLEAFHTNPGAGPHIPSRTLRRYYAALNKAEGDPFAAAEACHDADPDMSRDNFWVIWAALNAFADLDEVLHVVPDEFGTVEDHYLADLALKSLSGSELQVVRLAFGFVTGEPLSDAEVAAWLAAMQVSGPRSIRSVIEIRHRAVRHMRKALGVDP